MRKIQNKKIISRKVRIKFFLKYNVMYIKSKIYIESIKNLKINKKYILYNLGIFKITRIDHEMKKIIFSEVVLFKNAKNKPDSV